MSRYRSAAILVWVMEGNAVIFFFLPFFFLPLWKSEHIVSWK